MTSPTLSQAELREAVAELFALRTIGVKMPCAADRRFADRVLALVSSTKGGGDQGFGCLEGKPCDAWKAAHDQFAGDVLAMNAVVRGLQAKLQQAERALEEIADAKAHHIVTGSPGPLYSAGWAGACAMLAEHARQALSSIRQTTGSV